MAKQLKRYVTVAGATYGPDDELPKEVADAIDNPGAFEDADDRTPSMVVADKQGKELLEAGEGQTSSAAKKS